MSQLVNPLVKERRGATRSDTAISAYLITQGGKPLRGIARNLSRSGVFVEIKLPEEWLVGESARLVFAVSDGKVIRLAGYSVLIVREAQNGVGVAFWRSARPAHYCRGS